MEIEKIMQINITPLALNELDTFLETFNRLVNTQFPEFSEATKEFMCKGKKESYTKKLKEGDIMLTARKENKIVGFLVTDTTVGGVSFGDWLAVDEEYQNHGIGSRLIETWEKMALSQGVHNLLIQADARNVAYYEKRGFANIGLHQKGYWGADAYFMSKDIAEPREENFLK